jgi:hypothetical protein
LVAAQHDAVSTEHLETLAHALHIEGVLFGNHRQLFESRRVGPGITDAELDHFPAEIHASAKVRFAEGDSPGLVAERAAALIDAGVTLPLINFPRPLDPHIGQPIADELASLLTP